MHHKTPLLLLILGTIFSILMNFSIAYHYGLPDPPPVEGACVPVHPITGAPCPECCQEQTFPPIDDGTTEDVGDAEEEECTFPTSRDCQEECAGLKQEKKKCVFPAWRNCRQECAGLPSYPTYEFEACLTKCDNRNLQDRADYDKCVEQQGTSSNYEYDNCLAQCDNKNSEDSSIYQQCVEQRTQTEDETIEDDEEEETKNETEKPGENFDFAIVTQADPEKVNPGKTASFPINVKLLNGKPEKVLLVLAGKGIFDLVEFDRTDWDFDGEKSKEDFPTFDTTLTLRTTKDTVPGIYKLSIRGNSVTASDSADITLMVIARTVELNYTEFISYLKKLEKANKGKNKDLLITRLHRHFYWFDIDTVKAGISLFKHGPESNGDKNVDIMSSDPPNFVIAPDGTKIHIAHSYAALRSDLNRKNKFRKWFMRNVNTHWGDYYQVLMWVWDTKIPPRHPQAPKNLKEAIAGYANPGQLKGDDIGWWLHGYYQKKGNENKPLSEAYSEYFGLKDK